MYKLSHDSIIRLSDNARIPMVEGNMDYKAYKEWLDEGNTPAPADPVDPNSAILEQMATLEATVTNRRLREATLGTDNGWLADIDAQIATLRKSLK